MVGQMRDKITFKRPQDTQLPGGSGETSYFLYYEPFAKVENLSASRSLEDSQIRQVSTKRFTIRYDPFYEITQGLLIEYEGHDYTINRIIEINERKRFIQITAETDFAPPQPIFTT